MEPMDSCAEVLQLSSRIVLIALETQSNCSFVRLYTNWKHYTHPPVICFQQFVDCFLQPGADRNESKQAYRDLRVYKAIFSTRYRCSLHLDSLQLLDWRWGSDFNICESTSSIVPSQLLHPRNVRSCFANIKSRCDAEIRFLPRDASSK
jgi:hypothetical protein